MPPERSAFYCCQFLGNKTQLDKGLHSLRQHPVEDVVDILIVVYRLAARILTIDKHVVMEEPMEANILEARIAMGHLQFFLPCRAQCFIRTAGPHNLTPEMNERLALLLSIRGEPDRLSWANGLRTGHGAKYYGRPEASFCATRRRTAVVAIITD
jgi:hypothetical protein